MRRIALLPAVALPLLLTACAPMAPRAAAPPPAMAGPCNAEGARWAIGRAVDQALVNQVIHDTGSRIARVVEPGEPVTLDYNRERVSIMLNERGAIVGIQCG